MTEGRNPNKGEPEPPDTGGSSATATTKKRSANDPAEPEVLAYAEGEPEPPDGRTSIMGEPEPPDDGTTPT